MARSYLAATFSSKAAKLPEAAQDQIGCDLLEHIDALARLRAKVGIREPDAGEGATLDVEDIIRQARAGSA